MTAEVPPFRPRPQPVVGLVAGGLGAYWPQFPQLLPQLKQSAELVSDRLGQFDAQVVDVGFISDAQEAAQAAEQLRAAGCDLIIMFLTTYMTATMVVPIAQRSGAPLLLVNLQPTEAMDHAHFGTGEWLAYCGCCPLPEVANVFERCGVPFRSVSGYLADERAWERIGQWVSAAAVRKALRDGRHGLMGHLYPGMYDVSTDLTFVPAMLGGHVEVLEIDDLRVLVDKVTDKEVAGKLEQVRSIFEIDPSVDAEDLDWAARVSVGLDQLADNFGLSSLAYYYRGLDGELHERLGAGLILGASLLTAAGVPACGEYELRTSIAMLIMDRLGAGGSFTEMQALNFHDGVVEMGHDGPAHLAISEGAPVATRPGCVPRQKRLGRLGGIRRGSRTGHGVRHQPRPSRRPAFCGVRGRGATRPAVADRQYHIQGRLRLRPWAVVRFLVGPLCSPLGTRDRSPGQGPVGCRRAAWH